MGKKAEAKGCDGKPGYYLGVVGTVTLRLAILAGVAFVLLFLLVMATSS